MTNPTAPVSETQARSVLEAFVTENPELERLESLLAQFNIFEALGAVRHEVRHSDFLAYLLNPQENHGLGDAFIKRLLQKAIGAANSPDLPVTLDDIASWDFGAATVQREWQRIDISFCAMKCISSPSSLRTKLTLASMTISWQDITIECGASSRMIAFWPCI